MPPPPSQYGTPAWLAAKSTMACCWVVAAAGRAVKATPTPHNETNRTSATAALTAAVTFGELRAMPCLQLGEGRGAPQLDATSDPHAVRLVGPTSGCA